MRGNSDETLKRASQLRDMHGSWLKVSKQSRSSDHSVLGGTRYDITKV